MLNICDNAMYDFIQSWSDSKDLEGRFRPETSKIYDPEHTHLS